MPKKTTTTTKKTTAPKNKPVAELDVDITNNIPTEDIDVVDDILAELAGELEEEAANAAEEETGVKFQEDNVDELLSTMSASQVVRLRQMLNSTPEEVQDESNKKTITLRLVPETENTYIKAIKPVYTRYTKNQETGTQYKERFIQYQVIGSDEWHEAGYREFLNFDRVPCEVKEETKKEKKVFTGRTTIHTETRQEVKLYKTYMRTIYTVDVPGVGITKVNDEIVNA